MDTLVAFFEDLYRNFNDRNIEAVTAHMSTDVRWANGMDGGHVYGREGVTEYWRKQFSLVRSEVTPMATTAEGNLVTVKVHQVVHDLQGNLLSDSLVKHIFRLEDGSIATFDIETGSAD